jgi:serine/threonine protein phosphatase PrpC
MKIQIAAPLSIHGMGKRSNNEDNLFPPLGSATDQDNLFLVCDGVGGSDNGEIASEIACKTITVYYKRNGIAVSETATVQNAVNFALAEIKRYVAENPGSEKMATTLTFLHLHEQGATVAHIGDSRVYHIRDGAVMWRTQDHSYVNDLVKAGVITPEEALTHPRRNVIMRALQAESAEVQADVHLITDLKYGDYFFLCSDGILESITETELMDILDDAISDKVKMQRIEDICETSSNDNFTAYLIHLKSIEQLTVELVPETVVVKKSKAVKTGSGTVKKNSNINLWLVLLLVLICSGWYLLGKKKAPNEGLKPKTEQLSAKVDSIVVKHPAKPKKLPVKSKKNNKQQ